MVVHKLYIVGFAVLPGEAYPPPLVHADAVLALPVALQLFKLVSRRHAQKLKSPGCVQLLQSTKGPHFDFGGQDPADTAPPELLRMFVCETNDQLS